MWNPHCILKPKHFTQVPASNSKHGKLQSLQANSNKNRILFMSGFVSMLRAHFQLNSINPPLLVIQHHHYWWIILVTGWQKHALKHPTHLIKWEKYPAEKKRGAVLLSMLTNPLVKKCKLFKKIYKCSRLVDKRLYHLHKHKCSCNTSTLSTCLLSVCTAPMRIHIIRMYIT